MGAVFFMAFLAILFFVAMFFIILSIINIVKWKKQKRNGKTPKKWLLVVHTILLIINMIVVLIPIGYIGILRYANSIDNRSIVNVKTNKILYWPMDTSQWQSSRTWFDMDGIKYVAIHKDLSILSQNSNDSFYFEYEKNELGIAVANIKYNPKTSNFFNEFMTWLLTGSTADKLGTSTIYPIINENGFELYHVNAYTDNSVFCPENILASVRAYYLDIVNYETQNVTVGYKIYSKKGEGSGIWLRKPYIIVKKEKMLAPNFYNELENIYYNKKKFFDYINISEKYIELAEIAAPDTPVNGYDERQIYVYSKDKLAYRNVRLALIEEQVYVITSSGSRYIHGYPLRDEEMNQYIIDTVFY